jgi:hypothetical protein
VFLLHLFSLSPPFLVYTPSRPRAFLTPPSQIATYPLAASTPETKHGVGVLCEEPDASFSFHHVVITSFDDVSVEYGMELQIQSKALQFGSQRPRRLKSLRSHSAVYTSSIREYSARRNPYNLNKLPIIRKTAIYGNPEKHRKYVVLNFVIHIMESKGNVIRSPHEGRC